jgi:hypothetical protein
LLDSSQTEVKSSTARIYLNGFDLLLWHFNLNKGMGELYPDKGKEQSLLLAITNFPAWRYRTSSEGETIHASISFRGLFSEFWGTLLLCLNHMLWGGAPVGNTDTTIND